MKRIATIGVHGFTAATFLEKLTDGGAGGGLLLGLRQHRGVHSPDYSWANIDSGARGKHHEMIALWQR